MNVRCKNNLINVYLLCIDGIARLDKILIAIEISILYPGNY